MGERLLSETDFEFSSTGKQFGRYVELEIRDFKNKIKTKISNEFEIEFDYFKTLDQTKEDDSGKITIYGLTPERIASLQDGGGEVTLRCGYLGTEISTLFIAHISRLYAERGNNTTVTTIECSANLMHYYYSDSVSPEGQRGTTIVKVIENAASMIGIPRVEFNLSNIPENEHRDIQKFLETFSVRAVYSGSVNIVLSSIATTFGLMINIDTESQDRLLTVSLNDFGISRIRATIDKGYAQANTTQEQADRRLTFFNSMEADPNSLNTIVLIRDTGLIDLKTEYKIATAYLDIELNANEEETRESKSARNKKNVKEQAKKDKAESKGKKYADKTVRKRQKIKVNRAYNRITALLNPLVKPQGSILVSSSLGDSHYVCRVRSVTFKGNNKQGDWIMDIYAEHTTDLKEATEQEIELSNRVSGEESPIQE